MPFGANAALGGLNVNVGVNLQQFNTGMAQVEQRAQQTTSSLNRMGQALTTGAGIGAGLAVATTALSGVSRMAEAAGSAVIGLNSQLEQAKIGFTAFTGSVEKADQFVRQLQQFAATTAFEFPGLLQAARQLTGMGIAAEAVIPMLKEVGAVVMGMGGGEVEIKRVNRALTQMIATGKVQADEMNQLAEAGIPAWKMLADSMGLSIGQVRALSKQGQISAQQMLQAFHDFAQNNNLDEAMEKMNRSWTVASTNITDGLRNLAAEGFEPLFNVIRDGAVELGQLLTSDSAQQFAADLKATMTDVMASLRPVQDAIARIWDAFKTGGPSGAFDQILTEVQNLAQQMLGAGYNVVSEFASGLMSGASSLIEQAANFIADTIASYLIGNSPPPVGPLSQIAQGGANVIAAYVEGMAQGLTGIEDIATRITDALGNVGRSLTLAEGQEALRAAGTDMKALQTAAEQAEGAIRTIDDALKENQSTLRDYQNAATDIKDAYDAAIEPLQRQVEALRETNDLAQKQADLQTKLQLAQLKGALQQAQGDPVVRARLESQLDQLDAAQKQLQLQERELSLNTQAARLAATARGEKYKDTANDARKNQLAQQRLQLDRQEHAIRMQLEGMVDKEAVARIKGQQAQVQAVQAQRDINNEVANLQRQLEAAPLEAQIKELQSQQQALLDPIKERVKELERERETLQSQKTAWQDIKQNIADVMRDVKAASKEAATAAKDAIANSQVDVGAIFGTQKIDEAATKVGTSFATKITDTISGVLPQLIGGALGGMIGGSVFGPLGAIAGAAFGNELVKAIQAKIPNLGTILGDAVRTAQQAWAGEWKPPTLDENVWVSPFVEMVGKVVSRVRELFTQAQSGDISGAIIGLLGDVGKLAGELAAWLKNAVSQIPWAEVWKVTVDVGTFIVSGLTEATTALAKWLTDQVAAIDWAGVWQDTKNLAAAMQAWLVAAAQQVKWEEVFVVPENANAGLKTGIPQPQTWQEWFAESWAQITWENIFSVSGNIGSALTTGLDSAIQSVNWQSLGEGTAKLLLGAIQAALTIGRGVHEIVTGALQGMWEGGIAAVPYHAMTAIGNFVEGFINEVVRQLGLVEHWAKLRDALFANMAKVFTLPTGPNEMVSGGGIALGLLQGLADAFKESAINQTVGRVIQQAGALIIGLFKQAFGIASPSTVMIEIGGFLTQGLAQGITDTATTVTATVTTLMTQMNTEFTTGWTTIHATSMTQLDEIYALVNLKLTDMVGLVPVSMALMLTEVTTGWTAIHTQTDTQLTEIHALIQAKLAEMVALWPTAMTEMQTAVSTGLSAIHTQMTGQLGEIHGLIMMQTEQWRSAGLALGTALGEGIAAAQLNVQRSMMTMLSTSGGATGSKASPELENIINAAAAKYKLPAQLFMAQLQHESAGFDPRVISGARRGGAGELGLGQFMPATLQAMLQKNGLTLQQYLGDAKVQVELAAQHMAELVATFGDYDKALQAYNGGPGGVGSAATQRYAQIVHDVAATLKQQNTGPGAGVSLMSAGGAARGMALNIDQITAGRNAGLSMEEAQAICGPYAAVLFAQATGKNPSLAEAKQLAQAVGWTAQRGMGGTGNFMNLLGRMGIQAVRMAATPENVNAALAAGNPIALSTPRHYFVGSGGTAQGGINVGATGSVMSRYGGSANMTLAQITEVGGGMNDLIVLTQKLDAAGTQTFNNLTRVTGQFGDVVDAEVASTTTNVQDVATTGTQANQQLAASTQTLAASINQGVVPAGLAARDAVGQMAIGIQPLIAAWANGQMSSSQLAESLVQLAAQTGLATQPLASFAAGNVSVGEALRQVMTQLALTDPAFAAIEQSMAGAQLTTEQLADVLLRGLANVTGSVSASVQQIATSAQPLSQAFQTGAISGEQFVQSVVELAAQSGLTQAPLRQMQDGVLTTNQALAEVLTSVQEVNPAFAEMATGLADQTQPATEAAQAFLDWSTNMQDAQAATEEQVQVIQQVPEAVTDIQQPMAEASTTAMQTLPTATTEALDATVSAIQGVSGPAAEAAAQVGQAIVDSLRSTVEAGAESIAQAAQDIVEKALEAAKKAAEKVKDAAKESGGSGDKSDEKAAGGRLTAGAWTLVGEEGPELISPSGYVYTAEETTSMLLQGIAGGLFTLNKFAKGGKTKKSSKKESSSSSNSAPQRVDIPKYKEILDFEEAILKKEQEKNKVVLANLPVEEALRLAKRAQEAAARGTLEQQLKINEATWVMKNVDAEIAKIRYQDTDTQASMLTMETRLTELQQQQAYWGKGNLETRLKLVELEGQRLVNERRIAEIEVRAAPARAQLADVEQRIAEIQRGSIDDQIRSFNLQTKQKENQYRINELQIQATPLQAEEARLQRDIQRTLEGNAQQRQQMAQLASQTAVQDLLAVQNQAKLLPIQKQITDYQRIIEDAQRGSLADQLAAIDAETQSAALRMQEIKINKQLRDIEAGTLNMSQEQINALHKQLEVIENQKADISDQNELKQLQAQIDTAGTRKQVVGLQEQERVHTRIAEDIDYQRSLLQNQTGQIQNQNNVSAAGQQQRLTQVQTQLEVFTDQISELEAQNQVLNLQVANIQLGNDIRAAGLGAELITLQNQVAQYDAQVARINTQNNLIAAQSNLLNANNAVAAQGLAAQITGLEHGLELRNIELTKLEAQKNYLQGQISLIETQNAVSAAMHNENIIRLQNQKLLQDQVLEDINAQLGSLNAQKQIYEDIWRLAQQIANRPVNAPPAPTNPGGSGGPPGTVAATATKNGEQTLYLSRGAGIDGWYTSSGQLIVQGANSNPPSGYRVRWLASGGTWHAGEMAVLGEEGPEIAIAARDMHVFPHEKSENIARAFGRASTFRDGHPGGGDSAKNVTVNVEYHRHGGTDYGEGTLQQVVREAIYVALRS